jgi:predicted nucleotidyltransferase
MSDHGAMDLRPGIVLDDASLADFATRHGIRRLAAFGSVLRDDFDDDSDIDLLVEFEPGQVPGLLAIAAMEIELGERLGREVDLRTLADLSRHFRDEVRSSARELYAAA